MSKVANYNISLKCFIKNKKGETLILKTNQSSSFLGTYDFPGGRIDKDEFEVDYIDILKREIFEETGLKDVQIENKVVAIGRHKVLAEFRNTIKEDNYIFYIFYEGLLDCEECAVVSNEHQDFKWVKLEEIVLEDYFISGYLEGVKMYLSKK
ncbi:NUDIX domain-containing protein [Candidatus Gracilibacteria bacterium]|nr:NUDIX domain-containing protein [Candidatus Gracilibacteria bacterium]